MKETYTRDEVERLCFNLIHEINRTNDDICFDEVDSIMWIKENLK